MSGTLPDLVGLSIGRPTLRLVELVIEFDKATGFTRVTEVLEQLAPTFTNN